MNHGTSRRSELGQSLPIIILMLIILCGFVGLTIDVGYGMLEKRRLQSSVDLGLISGATKLPNATTAAADATTFTRSNFQLASNESINVSTTTGCMVPGCTVHDRLNLTASTNTPTFFVKLFGIDHWNVAARGSACGPCDSSPVSYDVMVVLDRSGSMSDQDMDEASEGIEELFNFFDINTDRIGLTILESADTVAPQFHSGSGACDYGGSSFSSTSYSPLTDAYTGYGGAVGAFMDGTAANHDSWLVVPLASGTNYKKADGTINTSSSLVTTLNCIDNRGSTPIGPAMQAATNELNANGRPDSMKVIVYFGDGGASSMPLQRQCRRRANSSSSWSSWGACLSTDSAGGSNREWRINSATSWYTYTTGNRDRPCQDAIDQSARATSMGFSVYAIGYGVGTDWCRPGMGNSSAESPNIRQADTIKRMASTTDKYYEKTNRGDVQSIFQAIGHQITSGGTRLVD